MIDTAVLMRAEMQVFLYFALGILLKKIHMTGPREDQFLSELLMGLIMPLNVFAAFYQPSYAGELAVGGLLILGGILVILLTLLAARLLPLPIPADKKRIAEFCMLMSNGSMIGLPLIEALYGMQGVFYANIFMTPTRVLTNVAGQRFFDPGSRGNGFKKGLAQSISNPLMIGMAAGFLFNLLGVPLPSPVMNVCNGISGCMSPLALILVGSALCDTFSKAAFRQMFSLPVLLACLFRLLASPWLTLLACTMLGLTGTQRAAAVLINAMPVTTTAVIFCQKYHGDTRFTSICTFVSTILSFATLWLIRF